MHTFDASSITPRGDVLTPSQAALLRLLWRRLDELLWHGQDCQRCGDVVPKPAWAQHTAEHLGHVRPVLPPVECLARNARAYDLWPPAVVRSAE